MLTQSVAEYLTLASLRGRILPQNVAAAKKERKERNEPKGEVVMVGDCGRTD